MKQTTLRQICIALFTWASVAVATAQTLDTNLGAMSQIPAGTYARGDGRGERLGTDKVGVGRYPWR